MTKFAPLNPIPKTCLQHVILLMIAMCLMLTECSHIYYQERQESSCLDAAEACKVEVVLR